MVFVSLSMDPSICKFMEDRLELLSPYMVLSSLSPFYNLFLLLRNRNKSTEVRPSGKIGSGTTEIPFSMFLRQPGKDNLERFYETFHGANISAQI
ncbi:uncharacterized protein LOC112022826 isoform X2 [Quercus suber]|uniref:uncharacterized protein LOC112022826 isoform X2 n=1 Tax=Quercus suber TaxID=58331 RepID=UPI0032DED0B3